MVSTLFIATVLVLSGIIVQFTVRQANDVPTFFIDLDKAPVERFKEVGERYSFFMRILVRSYKKAVMHLHNVSLDELNSIVRDLGQNFHQEYKEEMQGLAKAAGIDVVDIFFLHVHYELSSMCTSILCVDNENVVWLFRNFDYFRAMELKPLIVTLDFQKNSRSVYKGSTYVGLVSISNGVKRDSYSFAVNRRTTHGGTLKDNLEHAAAQKDSTGNVWPALLIIRKILDKQGSGFNDVVEEFSKVQMMAAAYIIIADRRNDGVILTRNKDELVSKKSLDVANGTWFVHITNTDVGSEYWKTSEWRYHKIQAAMTKFNRADIRDEKVFELLKASHSRKSVFSSILSVETYYHSTVLVP